MSFSQKPRGLRQKFNLEAEDVINNDSKTVPDIRTEAFFNGQFGAVRFCYSNAVALKGDLYRKKVISQFDSISPKEAVRHTDTGFKRFFKKEA